MKEDELSCRRLKPEEKLAGDEVGQGARGEEGELAGEGGGQELGGVAAFRAKPAVRRLQRTVNRCITLRLRMLPMGDAFSCIPWLFQQVGREIQGVEFCHQAVQVQVLSFLTSSHFYQSI